MSEYSVAEDGGQLEMCAEIKSAHKFSHTVIVTFKSTEGMQCTCIVFCFVCVPFIPLPLFIYFNPRCACARGRLRYQ